MKASIASVVTASLASLAVADRFDRKPLVSPEALQSRIRLHDLLQGTQQLEDFAYAYPERNRVFGGKAHEDTVNYIYRELKKTGYYDVYKQPQVHLWTKSDQSLIVDGAAIDSQSMTYSPSGNFTAPIALVSNLGCSPSDYPADVAGKIALVQRGECTFAEKSVYAGAADAVAAIVYNNVDGSLSGTLGAATSELGPYVPIVGISLADGQQLVSRLGSADRTAQLYVHSEMENRTTYNVVAETKGGDHANVVALGGHTDSVEAGPGINDDGSGIISNLVVAKALTKFTVKNAVRFLFWTAEEFGLLGSEHYVASLDEAERSKIRLYLNFDMIASPNYGLFIYDGDGSAFNLSGPAGSAEIEYLFQDYFGDRGLPFKDTEFNGRSDYAAFIDHGIPAGGLFTGAEQEKTEEEVSLWGGEAGVAYDANYHRAGDDMKNLNRKAFLINSQATAFAVATYARSLDGFPARDAAVKRDVMKQRRQADHTVHAHKGAGCFHSLVSM